MKKMFAKMATALSLAATLLAVSNTAQAAPVEGGTSMNSLHWGYVCTAGMYFYDGFGDKGGLYLSLTSEPYCEGDYMMDGYVMHIDTNSALLEQSSFAIDTQAGLTLVHDAMIKAALEGSMVRLRQFDDDDYQIIEAYVYAANPAAQVTESQTPVEPPVATCVDMGAPGNIVSVANNACLKIEAGVPSWYTNTQAVKLIPSNFSGGATSVPFTVYNSCAGISTSDQFDAGTDLYFNDADLNCPLEIILTGDGSGTMSLVYYIE